MPSIFPSPRAPCSYLASRTEIPRTLLCPKRSTQPQGNPEARPDPPGGYAVRLHCGGSSSVSWLIIHKSFLCHGLLDGVQDASSGAFKGSCRMSISIKVLGLGAWEGSTLRLRFVEGVPVHRPCMGCCGIHCRGVIKCFCLRLRHIRRYVVHSNP